MNAAVRLAARSERWRSLGGGTIAAIVAFLPFARAVSRGESFYFRDLSLYFFPLRRFAVEGLRSLEVRFWNPYVHGGVPLALPPIAYPFDLLQVLLPDERGFSLLLALHLPLAAVSFFVLARSIVPSRAAAVGGAVAYSLGGFALSTVNLYVYLEAFAWAPLVIWSLVRAASGGRRRIAVAAALVAIATSTTAIEIVAQTVLIGALFALERNRTLSTSTRAGAAVVLGVGVCAAPLWVVAGAMTGSARAAGFPTEVTLAHSIHPMTLLQVVVGGLYGDLHRIADRFWGQNFFPLGFPYLLSLYLGATTLALAALGALQPHRLRFRLICMCMVALVVCLGPWAGLGPLVEALPLLRRVRYPSKAFFTVHTSVAILASLGLDTLARSTTARRSWRGLALALTGAFAVLVGARWLSPVFADATSWFLAHFFPSDAPMGLRRIWLSLILDDAARGGLLVGAGAVVAVLAAAGRLRAPLAVTGLVALVAVDLLRTGAGLNPTVTPDFFTPSPEARQWAQAARGDGRVFTCDVGQSRSYLALRGARPGGHETWSFALLAESLTPLFNVRERLSSALSPDLTMLVPVTQVSSPEEASCRDLVPLVPRLREAGVGHVLSLDPLFHPDLTRSGDIAPIRVAPAIIHTYAVRAPRVMVEVEGGEAARFRERPGDVQFESYARDSALAVVNMTPHAGWTARVDGLPAPVTHSREGRLMVPLAPGRHQVSLRYRPPGLTAGLLLSGFCGLLVCLFATSRPSRSPTIQEPR
jgi:Bacterial membrane protein YfhO